MRAKISRIISGFDRVRDEMDIILYCRNEGSYKVSLHCFENRTLSELWVFINKICRTSELNELLYECLKEFALNASPQITSVPYEVKLFKNGAFQTCALDEVKMKDYPAKHLVWVENLLRTSGFATQEKTAVADFIQAYCERNIKRYTQMKNKLKKPRAQPVRPPIELSERDRIYDKELLEALDKSEEGEIRDRSSVLILIFV